MTFVFFHVGPPLYPSILVRSLRAHHPDARIVQYTGGDGPQIEGVTECHYLKGDVEAPILFRTECFAKHEGPATFMDTDMIALRKIDNDLGDADVGICQRTYDINQYMNPDAFVIDITEYRGKQIKDVYPYVGCIAQQKNNEFWKDCLEQYRNLPEKFKFWFGDQEAIRDVIKTGKYKIKPLPEDKYARLLDHDHNPDDAYALHFKGKSRKAWMVNAAIHLGLMTKAEIEHAKAA